MDPALKKKKEKKRKDVVAGDVPTNVIYQVTLVRATSWGLGTHKPHVPPAGSVIVDCSSVSCSLSSSVPAPTCSSAATARVARNRSCPPLGPTKAGSEIAHQSTKST